MSRFVHGPIASLVLIVTLASCGEESIDNKRTASQRPQSGENDQIRAEAPREKEQATGDANSAPSVPGVPVEPVVNGKTEMPNEPVKPVVDGKTEKPNEPGTAALPPSQLSWDGASFVGTDRLALLPIE